MLFININNLHDGVKNESCERLQTLFAVTGAFSLSFVSDVMQGSR